MEIKFQVGDQVVAAPLSALDWSIWEKRGFNIPYPKCIYTVRELYLCPTNGEVGVRLVEVVNPPCELSDGTISEIGWYAKEFQPVKKTDISNFKKLERPNKPKEIIIHKTPVKEKV